ncbi:MAG TPA: heme-binding sensor globin domain-containing protein [Proteobacteria bacterium]|nr:globin-coupled histidine kinase [bacterium BMS3Abin14]HDL53844.1 heme-binding sensor globin domain-containing protein [Pseudomonadota bacterium]
MLLAKDFKSHYEFTAEEEQLLKELAPLMEIHKEEFAEDFYGHVMSNKETAEFFPTEAKLDRHRKMIAGWFMDLFGGKYDDAYIRNLKHVGKVHVNIKLDGHFVNTSMARVRRFLSEVIESHAPEEKREEGLIAVGKILDINLDILTSSYRQEELKKYFLSFRVEKTLVNWIERFTHGLNLILALALGVVSAAVVVLFVHDVIGIFRKADPDSIIAALGSLLIIWLMIELLDTEISHLKGRKLQIKVFVGVIMVAFLRKVLIAGFRHEELLGFASKVGTLLVLGIVYWLVVRAERE